MTEEFQTKLNLKLALTFPFRNDLNLITKSYFNTKIRSDVQIHINIYKFVICKHINKNPISD